MAEQLFGHIMEQCSVYHGLTILVKPNDLCTSIGRLPVNHIPPVFSHNGIFVSLHQRRPAIHDGRR